MNKYVAKVLYYTHDKWDVEIKYKDDYVKLLEFCITQNRSETERVLKEVLHLVEDKQHMLTTVGLLNILERELPEIIRDYFIVYDNNKLNNFYKGDKNE